jgi:hypothetical protein
MALAMLQDSSAISSTAKSVEWWEVFDARQKDLEAISNSLIDSLEMYQSIPFDSALEVYLEYRSAHTPATVLSLARKFTSAKPPPLAKPAPSTH